MKWLIAIALLFTSLVILTRLGALGAEQRHPRAGEFAELDGFRLHYTDAGSGPAVVLVHGASTGLLDFQATVSGTCSATGQALNLEAAVGRRPGCVPRGVWRGTPIPDFDFWDAQ